MPIDFAAQVYLPSYNVFARKAIFTPTKSQPGQPSYGARGIFNTVPLDVETEGALFNDMRTILDILENEFSVLPLQGDQVAIPSDGTIPAAGTFIVINTDGNGGGETTLTLRRVVTSSP